MMSRKRLAADAFGADELDMEIPPSFQGSALAGV
jgi:hypothetical protein